MVIMAQANGTRFARRSMARLCALAGVAAIWLATLPGMAHAAPVFVAGNGQALAAAQAPAPEAGGRLYNGGWRVKLKDAAVISGERVRLGEIATPLGEVPAETWNRLAQAELWPAPPAGRPMNMTRPKIQQAMAHYARELSSLCVYPSSMVLQSGGAVLTGDDLRSLVVKTLTPHVRNLGDAQLQDFRLPSYLFLQRADQYVELEGPFSLSPGRISLRFAVKEPGGEIMRRATGTVFMDLWAEVPCAGTPLNKDELLTPERVTHIRKNLAHLKGEIWDGRGGPWRMQRVVSQGQPIMQSDVSVIPTVRKGAAVTMVFEGKNFTASMPGEAMSDGAAGDSIVVRNLQSKKQLRATVRDSMTVVVR